VVGVTLQQGIVTLGKRKKNGLSAKKAILEAEALKVPDSSNTYKWQLSTNQALFSSDETQTKWSMRHDWDERDAEIGV
jgi:hypothetical protein